jgi:hypothetical protein
MPFGAIKIIDTDICSAKLKAEHPELFQDAATWQIEYDSCTLADLEMRWRPIKGDRLPNARGRPRAGQFHQSCNAIALCADQPKDQWESVLCSSSCSYGRGARGKAQPHHSAGARTRSR